MTASEHDEVWFTARGLRAMDDLAVVLTHQMENTPAGIARVLDQVMHAPVAELADALTAVADELRDLPANAAASRTGGGHERATPS